MANFKGILFCFVCFVTSFLGAIFILVPFFPLVFLAPKLWRSAADKLVGYWLSLPTVLVDFLFGIRFHVSGDEILSQSPAILLMNHRTRLDWMFLWSALYKIDPWLLTTEKISLKKELKKIPGASWAMECNNFIFLERNKEIDKKTMNESIDYYSEAGRSYQLLLFPEGTDMCPNSIGRSNKFADQNGLNRYNFVLHPRTTGFISLLKKMRERDYIQYVYDIEIAYPDIILQSESQLAQGIYPENVCVHVKRYKIDDIPIDEQGAVDWLNDKWMKKEEKLSHFYSKSEKERTLIEENDCNLWPVVETGTLRFGKWLCFIFWLITTCLWIYFFLTLTCMRIYFGLSIGLFYFCGWKFGGVEKMVIQRWLNSKKNN